MIDKLKTFISKHKQEFDTNEPGQDLWKKIDAHMEVKNSSWISSQWLSRFKYLGLSVSVLVVAVYFISKNLNPSSSNELAQKIRDSAFSNSGEWAKVNQNKSDLNTNENNITKDISSSKSKSGNSLLGSSVNAEKSTRLIQDSLVNNKRDSVLNAKPVVSNVSDQNKIKQEVTVNPLPKTEGNKNANVVNENKERKKAETFLAFESEKLNSYSCTIWDGLSFCTVIRAYKFPGQVSIDGTMKTIGCSKLESINNLKAVCLKGRTARKITLSLGEGFKNIILEKSDGRKLNPEAISHYYTGLGVISGYTGKYFDIFFKDKVELILFFKDVEEGDKITIDGTIEVVVKNKP